MRLLAATLLVLIISVCIVHTAQPAAAGRVSVQIYGTVISDFRVAEIDDGSSTVAVYLGAHNTGSIEYAARARIDIVDGEQVLFTGWSEKKELNPGQRKGFVVYGYKPDASNLSVRARLYHGNEISELGPVAISGSEADGATPPLSAFSIMNFRVYDSHIRFDIASNQSVEDILIIPQGLPATWVIEQAKIGSMRAGSVNEVILYYETGFFRERDITIAAATEDGRYYSGQSFQLRKESGIAKYINLFTDWVGGLFRS